MDLFVVDHHLDALAGVYRMTLGVEEIRQEQKVDADGVPVFESVPVPVSDDSDEQLVDANGDPVFGPGPPVMEDVRVLVPVDEVVFSAEDPKWEGKSDEEIVKEQKRLVRAALRQREEDAKPRPVEAMPGVGDPL